MSVDAHGNLHTPAGVTTGGQFTGKAKAETEVPLTDSPTRVLPDGARQWWRDGKRVPEPAP
jgi:hypothetical protein